MAGYIGQVHIDQADYKIGSTLFAILDTDSTGTIDTNGETTTFSVPLEGFVLTDGVTIHIQFKQTWTNSSNSTTFMLKIGNTAAKEIKNPNGAIIWQADSVIAFTYDTNYYIMNTVGFDVSGVTIDASQLSNLTLGNISSSGTLTNTAATIATGDYLVITDASDNSGRIAKANISFDTTKTDYFLSQKGNWAQINKTTLGINNVTNHQQVHEVAWDNINKKITRSKDESVSDVVQFVQGSNITLTSETLTGGAGKLTIAAANNAVTQTNTTTDATYNLLFSYSTSTADPKTEGARKHSALTYNPSTGILSATKFSGDGSGLTNVTASSVELEHVTGADDLKKIEALTGTTGLLKKTAANTWTLDTTSYATSAEVSGLLAAADAMTFKGTIGAGGTINTTNNETLPTTHTAGDTYKVITAGTYAGQVCEVGDLIICIKDVTNASNAADSDWTVTQTNIDGAVTGPATSTANHIATFNDGSGKIIKDSGYTIATSVPSGAIFTDNQVAQVLDTSSNKYALLFSDNQTSITTATITTGAKRNNSIYVTPSAGSITATKFIGALEGTLRASDVKSALETGAESGLVFLHKSGNWKTLQITNTTTPIASVSNGILTLAASVQGNAVLGIAT